MGGCDKRFVDLLGKPMLQWVIDAVRPQVDRLVINAPASDQFAPFNLPLVPDRIPDYRGPLMGLYSAMYWNARHDNNPWLAVFACDTPLLPPTLIASLLATAQSEAARIVLVRTDGQLQPTASVWHQSLLPAIETAVMSEKVAGFLYFLQQQPFATLDWPDSESWRFYNANTPVDLAEVEQLARAQLPC